MQTNHKQDTDDNSPTFTIQIQ